MATQRLRAGSAQVRQAYVASTGDGGDEGESAFIDVVGPYDFSRSAGRQTFSLSVTGGGAVRIFHRVLTARYLYNDNGPLRPANADYDYVRSPRADLKATQVLRTPGDAPEGALLWATSAHDVQLRQRDEAVDGATVDHYEGVVPESALLRDANPKLAAQYAQIFAEDANAVRMDAYVDQQGRLRSLRFAFGDSLDAVVTSKLSFTPLAASPGISEPTGRIRDGQ